MKNLKLHDSLLFICLLIGLVSIQSCKESKTSNADDKKVEQKAIENSVSVDPQDKPEIACLVIYKDPDDPYASHLFHIRVVDGNELFPQDTYAFRFDFYDFQNNEECLPEEPNITNAASEVIPVNSDCFDFFQGDLDLTYQNDGDGLKSGGCYSVNLKLTFGIDQNHWYYQSFENLTMYVVEIGDESCNSINGC